MSEPSKNRKIASWVVSALVGLAMVASSMGKFSGGEQILEMFEKMHLGSYRMLIGVIELGSAILFLVPRTSSLGTFLITGYFGGAIVAHLSLGEPDKLMPAIILGLLAWTGNFLRNPTMFQSFKGQ
jgi:hypothetical protein